MFRSLYFSRVYIMVNNHLYLFWYLCRICISISICTFIDLQHALLRDSKGTHPLCKKYKFQDRMASLTVRTNLYLFRCVFVFVLYFFLYLYRYSVYFCVAVTVSTNLPPPSLHGASKSKGPFWCSAPLLVRHSAPLLHHCYTIILVQSAAAGVQLHHC